MTVINVAENTTALDQEQQDCLERRLQKMTDTVGFPAELLIEHGEPDKAVAEAATRLNAGLLIIGRGSDDSTIGRLRAQAYSIVRQSPCPVLSV